MNVLAIPGFSEPVSSLSHLIAAVIFVIYGIKIVAYAKGKAAWVFALVVYIFTVVFLLSMSGVYHLLEPGGAGRAVLQRLDHAGIFGLIAGTFTPVHMILFKGMLRWGFLALIWILAVTCITLKSIFFNEMAEWFGLILYLGFGWLGILSAYFTHQLHGFRIILPLIYGALAYTVGAGLEFLQQPVLIPGILDYHELFHAAVILGIVFHWLFIRNLIVLKQDDSNSYN